MTQQQDQSTGGMPDVSLRSASAFVAGSGFEIDEITDTVVSGHADFGPDQFTPWGVVHGGVYTTIVETAGSVGGSHAVRGRGQFAVGVHNATDFLRPSTGGRALVRATALHQGRTQQLWEVVITSEESGKDLARGQLRVQNVPLPESTPAH